MSEVQNTGTTNADASQQQQQNAASQQTETNATTTQNEAWNDAEYAKITSRYKNDNKEVGKALWHNQKELTRVQQELAALKKAQQKSGTDSTTNANSNESTNQNQSSTQNEQPNEANKSDVQAKESKAKDAQAASETSQVKPKQILDSAYLEVFEQGKLSDATIKSFTDMGYDSTDAKILGEALQNVVQQRIKEAQRYVDTDVKTLKQFAEAEGNFTDAELLAIQNSLNLGQYGVLKDVERKYKASLKETVNHGTIAGTPTDVFNSPDEFFKAKNDYRFNMDKEYQAQVMAKYHRTDTSDWNQRILNKR